MLSFLIIRFRNFLTNFKDHIQENGFIEKLNGKDICTHMI